MNPKSHTLFHFTKSRETLKLILKNGFWPKYCLEDVSWLGYDKYNYVAYPMVCFCDIPLSRLSEHVNFYGEFGIGLTKQWAESNGLNPVFYVAGANNISTSFIQLNEHSNKLEGEERKAMKITNRYLLAHSKPANGTVVVDGKPVDKEFYQESEWRYVPKHNLIKDHLLRSVFEDSLEAENLLTSVHPETLVFEVPELLVKEYFS